MSSPNIAIDDKVLAYLVEHEKKPSEAMEQAYVLEQFRRGELSRGRACELLDMDMADFLDLASSLSIEILSR